MVIKKFRVKGYKSIVDSGDCYLESDLTIFAGKNESGKSTLLEALEDFNYEKSIENSVVPLDGKEEDLAIEITNVISAEEINNFFEISGFQKNTYSNREIKIKKDYYDTYVMSAEDNKFFNLLSTEDDFKSMKEVILNLYNDIVELHEKFLDSSLVQSIFTINFKDLSKLQKDIAIYTKALEKIDKDDIDTEFDLSKYVTMLESLIVLINTFIEVEVKSVKDWRSFLQMIPNFVLFRSFEDNIPNSIPFKDINNNQFIKDFKLVSKLDTNLIVSNDKRKIHMHKDALNIDLNKDYSIYWTQDATQLKIEWDSNDLFFWVVEEGQLYQPNQRSKGKQWHISFYLRVLERTVEGKTNVILVDEPGLFLHASAQRDIYQRLLDSSRNDNVQIIFTTHSPYLLRSNELERIRLIEKLSIELGTVVINKVYVRADKETLTPILTAIGLELNQGVQDLQKIKNIVVEGPSDLFYLNAFAKLLKDTELNFVYGGGSGNMGSVGAILSGWGCKVVYLCDNDQGRTNGTRNLTRTWLVKKDLILAITKSYGAIEDIFTAQEFAEFVLNDKNIITDNANAQFVKDKKMDKVLLSRQFLAKVNKGEVTLVDETMQKLQTLFNEMNSTFGNTDLFI